jgi:hypothetical protein
MAKQAIHWAKLAAEENIENITIIIMHDINWYNNKSPHLPQYQDTHVIAYIQLDTLKYKTPLNPT